MTRRPSLHARPIRPKVFRLLKNEPGAFVRAARALGVEFDAIKDVSLFASPAEDPAECERRFDAALLVESHVRDPYLVIATVLHDRDEAKRGRLLERQAYMHDRYGLPTLPVVLSTSDAVAEWAAGPYRTRVKWRRALVFDLLAIGPSDVTRVRNTRAATDDIALAALAAVVHVNEPMCALTMGATAAAIATKPAREDMYMFNELIELGLGDETAAELWRPLMRIDARFFNSHTSQRIREQARLDQRAQDIVDILRRRELSIGIDDCKRIITCTDAEDLDRWFTRALFANSSAEVFDAALSSPATSPNEPPPTPFGPMEPSAYEPDDLSEM